MAYAKRFGLVNTRAALEDSLQRCWSFRLTFDSRPATGRQFASDWALLCTIDEDRIVRYQFFENIAAAVEAFRPLVALV